MAGGLGKVGRPAIDRFAKADAALGTPSDSQDAYVAPAATTSPAQGPTPAPSVSATVKKTLNLTTRTLDDVRSIDAVLMRNGRKAKETEILRAAIEWYARQSEETILEAYDAVEKLPTGPRRGG